MSDAYQKVVYARASVYKLVDNRKWEECGQAGQFMLYYYDVCPQDMYSKWWKNGQNMDWKLTPGKLKPKGDRAWVCKAKNLGFSPTVDEILAVRFQENAASEKFRNHYTSISAWHAQQSNKRPSQNALNQPNGAGAAPNGYSGAPPNGEMNGNPLPQNGVESNGYPPQQQNGYGEQQPQPPSQPPPQNGYDQMEQFRKAQEAAAAQIANSVKQQQQVYPPQQMQQQQQQQQPLQQQHQPLQQQQSQPLQQQQQQYHPQQQAHNGYSLQQNNSQKWECSMCTYRNTLIDQTCDVCHKDRTPNCRIVDDKPIIREQPSLNAAPSMDGLDVRSVVSGEDLPASPNVGAQGFGPSWSCDKCTYVNGALADKCDMCGTSKASFQFGGAGAGGPQHNGSDSKDFGVAAQMLRQHEHQQRLSSHAQDLMALEHDRRRIMDEEQAKIRAKVEAQQRGAYQQPVMHPSAQQEQLDQQQHQPMHNGDPAAGGGGRPYPIQQPHPPAANGAVAGGKPKKKWLCPICTLKNSPDVTRCEACDTPKSSGGYGMMMIDHDDNNSAYSGDSNYQASLVAESHAGGSGILGLTSGETKLNRGNSTTSLFDPWKPPDSSKLAQHRPSHKVNKLVSDFSMIQQKWLTNNTRDAQGRVASTAQDFDRVASDISCFNENSAPVFSTLRSVAKKLLKDNMKYRTLDTSNPRVTERLIGYEGVLDFLSLLGFECDQNGEKLVCKEKPHRQVVEASIEVLDSYERKIGMGARHAKKTKSAVHDPAQEQSGIVGVGNKPIEAPTGFQAGDVRGDEEIPEELRDEVDTMTLQQIVLFSTHESIRDNDTMETLIMTHRTFSDSLTLIRELKKRFFVQIPQDIKTEEEKVSEFTLKVMKPIQLNVVKNLRNWMKQYWDDDFKNDEQVQLELDEWIKKMCENSKIYSWNGLLADACQNEFKRYKKYGSGKKEEEIDYSQVKIPKKFNINGLSPDELADQVTLMDYKIFKKIKPRECLKQAWKKNGKENAPNILGMIQQFNNLTIFVQIQILREKSLRDRGKAIKRIIKMGEHFRESRNYNSLCAVFGALNSAPIHRLKLAWEKVPHKQKEQFDQFKVIFSRDFNHRNLRQLFRNAAAPSIPHTGLFLQDLVFIDDGNEDDMENQNLGRSLVNFSKCARLADRIKTIQMYQQHSFTTIKETPVVQRILQDEFDKLKQITEDTIWDMSTEIKKQDERDKTRIF